MGFINCIQITAMIGATNPKNPQPPALLLSLAAFVEQYMRPIILINNVTIK